MKKHQQTIILSISFIIIMVGFIVLLSKDTSNVSDSLNIEEKGTSSSVTRFSMEIAPGDQWKNSLVSYGGVYDFYFFNNTAYNLNNWSVVFKVPEGSYIDSAWDCMYEINGTNLIIYPLDYNSTAFHDESRKFGFVLYTPEQYEFAKCTLKGQLVFDYKQSVWWDILRGLSLIWVICFVSFLIVNFKIRSYKQAQIRDHKIILQSINTFVNFVDAKDPYTRGHSTRVALYAKEIGKRMQMDDDELQNLYYISLMHDVGKISIPDTILNKAGSLTPEEREVIKSHTTKGGEMLVSFTAIEGISGGALYHHERYDGTGYPTGLKGTDIPIYGRIICIADAYDAMSSNRCYRKHLTKETILNELSSNAGTQFDPDIVQHMINMINDGYTDMIQNQFNNFNGEF